jgi:hypothetical protein
MKNMISADLNFLGVKGPNKGQYQNPSLQVSSFALQIHSLDYLCALSGLFLLAI